MLLRRATCRFSSRNLSKSTRSNSELDTGSHLIYSALPGIRQCGFLVKGSPFKGDHGRTSNESVPWSFLNMLFFASLASSSAFKTNPLKRSAVVVPIPRFRRVLVQRRSRLVDPSCQHELSTDAEESSARDHVQLDFPGFKVHHTNELNFISEAPDEPVACYRILDDYGHQTNASGTPQVDRTLSLKMYQNMVALQILDTIFYEAQRQGRISFYLTAIGEEAVNVASAAALSPNDVVFPQYREAGVLMWRGFTLQQFANQCFGNEADYGKGRQMPAHYGSRDLRYFTISSPIATQLPQAVGAAYSLKMDKEPACAVTYLGDGASSEGDFHAALNFAAVFEVPVIFICRNNGWAISTPASEQYKSDGVAVKARAYGMRSICVDGNDTLAVYAATNAAREMAIKESRPILIEALTYRVGHHSTSDDSTKYRRIEEIEYWKVARNPVVRFRTWLEDSGWWSSDAEVKLRADLRAEVLSALQHAERKLKTPLTDLFTDVYDIPPENLRKQEMHIREVVARHPKDYPSDIPLK